VVEGALVGVVGHRVGGRVEVGGDGGAPWVAGGFRRGGDGQGFWSGAVVGWGWNIKRT
jgi:hypothetical protein